MPTEQNRHPASEQINFRANGPRYPKLAEEFDKAVHDHRSDRSCVLRELLAAYVRAVRVLGRPPKFPLKLDLTESMKN